MARPSAFRTGGADIGATRAASGVRCRGTACALLRPPTAAPPASEPARGACGAARCEARRGREDAVARGGLAVGLCRRADRPCGAPGFSGRCRALPVRRHVFDHAKGRCAARRAPGRGARCLRLSATRGLRRAACRHAHRGGRRSSLGSVRHEKGRQAPCGRPGMRAPGCGTRPLAEAPRRVTAHGPTVRSASFGDEAPLHHARFYTEADSRARREAVSPRPRSWRRDRGIPPERWTLLAAWSARLRGTTRLGAGRGGGRRAK